MKIQNVTDPQFVEAFQKAVAEEIGEKEYQLWFEGKTSILSVGAENAVIGVANDFLRQLLEDRFIGLLRDVASRMDRVNFRFEFQTDPSLAESHSDLNEEFTKTISGYTAHTPAKSSRMRFGNFITGEGNKLAFMAARSVAGGELNQYNPLLIHGDSGLGKTHLLAAAHHELTNRGGFKSIFASADDFSNGFTIALRDKTLEAFRKRYRETDFLALDDLQLLGTRKACQDEFFHTVDALLKSGSQVMLSSSAHPRQLKQFRKSFLNRLLGGLIVKLEQPDYGTKRMLAQSKCLSRQLRPEPEVLEILCQKSNGNASDLDGMINLLAAHSKLQGKKITPELCEEILQHAGLGTASAPKFADILDVIQDHFCLRREDLFGATRNRRVAHPRQIAMYLARKLTGASYAEIGEYFGGRRHSTVLFAEKKLQGEIDNKSKVRDLVALLTEKIRKI